MTNHDKASLTNTGKTHAYLLVLIFLLAAGLRVAHIQSQTFYIDEAFNFMLAQHSPADIIRGSASESNPPLPVLIAHVWIMGGDSIAWLRLLSVFFSLGALGCAYLLARRLAGPNGALAAALLMAVSPSQLFFADTFRYPAQAIFLGALGMLLFAKLTLDGNRRMLWPFAAVCAMSIYTHYFFIFLILFYNVYFLFIQRRGRAVGVPLWLLSQAAVAASFIPWLGYFSSQGVKELAPVSATQLAEHAKTFPFKGIVNAAQSLITGFYPTEDHKWYLIIVLIMLALFAAGFLTARSMKPERAFTAWAFAVALVTPYVMMFFFGLRIMPELYFCMIAPCFFVIIAQSVLLESPLPIRVAGALALAAVLVVSLRFYFVNVSPPRDNATAIKYMLDHQRPGDIVVVNPTYQASLFHYFDPENKLKLFGIPADFDILKYNYHETTQVDEHRFALLGTILQAGARVWAFFGFGEITKPDRDRLTLNHLEKNYKKTFEMPFAPQSFAGEVGRLYLFEKR